VRRRGYADEFNVPGRNFANGHDTKWTALNIGDTSNKGTAFYLPEQASVAVDTNVSGAPVSALLSMRWRGSNASRPTARGSTARSAHVASRS
jgi:hypothetical protein